MIQIGERCTNVVDGPTAPTDRRTFLAAAGAAATATSGCLDRIQASVDRNPPEQVSVSIKMVPRDEDDAPIAIARHLADNLERAGADVELEPMSSEQLLRDVLVNREFGIYVTQHPGHSDPDFLYGFLHSRFVEEAGWQNPLGYANVSSADEPLETQRVVEGSERRDVLGELQHTVVDDAPLIVVAFPDEPRAVRTDRYRGWARRSLEEPMAYIGLDAVDEDAEDDRVEATLHVGILDRRPTRNLNPFAVEFRNRGTITGLLYDPLGRDIERSIEPWLAETWDWNRFRGRPALRVRLREDLLWHDGESLTAADVAFTHRFLKDTTMTDGDPIVPSPRFRSESTLVDSVDVEDDRSFTIRFVDATRTVASRALTVPIIPEHVWEGRTEMTEIAGITVDHVTEAIVADNLEPVGSGPLRFAEATPNERLELARYDDHFLQRDGVTGAAGEFSGKPPYERLEFQFFPSDATMVELLRDGSLDATAMGISAAEVPRAGRAANVSLEIERTSAFYHVGFNSRDAPFSNPRFRQAVSRLIDREYLRREVFHQFATPALSPLFDTVAVPTDLQWEPDHDQGFVGESGEDGEVEPETARDLFRDAGYSYNDDDQLLMQT